MGSGSRVMFLLPSSTVPLALCIANVYKAYIAPTKNMSATTMTLLNPNSKNIVVFSASNMFSVFLFFEPEICL